MREKIEKGLTAIFLMLFMFVATNTFAQHSIEKHQTKIASTNSNTYDIIKHKVKNGDNLSGLAYRYKTTVNEIKQSNKLNREQVFLGETLKIPYNTINAKGSGAFINYTIHKGDSLSVIAAKYKTDTKSIQIANNLARSQVNIGQKIVIPYNKKYESSESFKTDVNSEVVSKATDKPIAVKLEQKSDKEYKEKIEEKYLSFHEKQGKLEKADGNVEKTQSDNNGNVVEAVAKTIESPVSNAGKISETVQISETNGKKYVDLEKSIKKSLAGSDKKEIVASKKQVPNIIAEKESDAPYIRYVVENGDSMSVLAEKYNTTSKEIRALNNLQSSQIKIGQKLMIPKMPPSPYMIYKVESGDSLSMVAENHGLTTKELMELNGLTTRQINIGQRLRIPKEVKNLDKKPDISKSVIVAKADKPGDTKVDGPFQIDSKEELILGGINKKAASKPKEIKSHNVAKVDGKVVKAPKSLNKNSHLAKIDTVGVSADRSIEKVQNETKVNIEKPKADKKEIKTAIDAKIAKQGKQIDSKLTAEAKKPLESKPEIKASNNVEEKSQKVVEVAKVQPETTGNEKDKIDATKDSRYINYVVKSGDSLSILAENNGMTTKELMELNNLSKKQINIGQKLKFLAKQEDKDIKLSDSERVLIAKADVKPVDIRKGNSSKLESKTELKSIIESNKETPKAEKVAHQKVEKAEQVITKAPVNTNENIELAKVYKKAIFENTSIETVNSESEAKSETPKADQSEIKTALDNNSTNQNNLQNSVQVASDEKVNTANNKEIELKQQVEVIKAQSATLNTVKEELDQNPAENEQEMAEKLAYMPEREEQLNENVTLAQLLTIENSNIPEEDKRYENLIDDQIMLAANNENSERYEQFAQKSPEVPVSRPKTAASVEEGTVDIPDEIDLRDFVRTISEITRESYILDEKLKSKKVTIVTPKGGFNKKNAIRLFEAILNLNGFTIYKKGILNVITETRNIKQKDIEVLKGKIISDPSDRFVTQIIPLKNISAQDVSNTLKPLVSREGDIVVYAPLNTLIIVETKSNLERLITILNNVDKEKDIIFVKIYNSEASDISAMLTEIFGGASASPISTTGDTDRGAERRRTTRRAAARSSAGGQSEIAGFKIITDERTNSLIVIAYPDDIPKIKAAIERLDVKVAEPEHGIYVIRLKNGDSEQIVNVLNSLISGAATTGRASRGFRATRDSAAGGNQAEGARARATRASASSGAVAEFSLEDIRITSDVSTNSIIVVGSRREFESVKRVVDELDIRRRQVFVEAAILEVSLDQLRSLGTNLSIGFTINDDNLGFGGTNLPGVPSLLGAAADSESTVSLVGSLSGMFLGVVGDEVDPDGSGPIPPIPSFSALFQALTSVTDVNILSTPSIVTTDNEEAEIVVADVIPFPTGSTVGDSGVTVNTIDRQPVGIRLAITPQIGDGDFLSLEIQTEVSSVRDAPSDLNTQDFGIATTTRTASSSVVVKNGQTIVIGGLVQDRESLLENRVPGLGNVPILGNLFKFKSKSSSKINLMILLTPRIIEDERDMKLILEDRQKRNMLLQQRGFDTEGVY